MKDKAGIRPEVPRLGLRALAFAFMVACPHPSPSGAQEQPAAALREAPSPKGAVPPLPEGAAAQVVGFVDALTLRVDGEVVELGPGSPGYDIPSGAKATVLAGEAQILVGGALAKAGAGASFAVEQSSGQTRLAVLSGVVEAASSDNASPVPYAAGQVFPSSVTASAPGGIGIGTTNQKTTSHVNRDLRVGVVSASADYPMTTSDYVVLGSGGSAGIAITLPSAAANQGMIVHIKKVDPGTAGAVTIHADGTDTIEGGTPDIALTGQYDSLTLVADGANMWYVLASTP